MILVISGDDENVVAGYVTAALVHYDRDVMSRNGSAYPPPVLALLVEMAARRGHVGPELVPRGTPGGPLAVPYATAAELLGISARTVRRRVADGSLPSVRIGSRRLVSVPALRRMADPGRSAS